MLPIEKTLFIVGVARLQDALEGLTSAIRKVEAELLAQKAEHDPLASHIFASRRHYQNSSDTKSEAARFLSVGVVRAAYTVAILNSK